MTVNVIDYILQLEMSWHGGWKLKIARYIVHWGNPRWSIWNKSWMHVQSSEGNLIISHTDTINQLYFLQMQKKIPQNDYNWIWCHPWWKSSIFIVQTYRGNTIYPMIWLLPPFEPPLVRNIWKQYNDLCIISRYFLHLLYFNVHNMSMKTAFVKPISECNV